MAARDDDGAGLGAARVLDGDEVQGVLSGAFYQAPPESGRMLKAERDGSEGEADALQGHLHLDVHEGPRAARRARRGAQGPRHHEGEPQRAHPRRARAARSRQGPARHVSECLEEAEGRRGELAGPTEVGALLSSLLRPSASPARGL